MSSITGMMTGLCVILASCAPAGPELPNILLIVIDSLRWDHLGFSGYRVPITPCLDSLAAEGAAFTACLAQASYTEASMPSLLTGRYPTSAFTTMAVEVEEHLKQRARATGEGVATARETGRKIVGVYLGEDVPTIASVLSDKGYTTAAFIANPMVTRRIFGLADEFDIFEESVSCATGDCAARLNELSFQRMDLIEQEPWFCYMHHMDVHLPYDPPLRFKERFWDQSENMPTITVNWLKKIQRRGPTAVEIEYITAMYDASIAYLDQEIGRLIQHLRERVPREKLFVVIASDHGDEFYEHHGFRHAQSLYQELIRCPLIMIWPGWIPRGFHSDIVVQNVDILPTICELIGIDIPQGVEGTPLIDVLYGDMVARPAFSEKPGISIIDDRWKLWKDHLGIVRLYNLDDDPGETRNLAKAYPETVDVLTSQLEEWTNSLSSPLFRKGAIQTTGLDSSTAKMLRSLGYLE